MNKQKNKIRSSLGPSFRSENKESVNWSDKYVKVDQNLRQSYKYNKYNKNKQMTKLWQDPQNLLEEKRKTAITGAIMQLSGRLKGANKAVRIKIVGKENIGIQSHNKPLQYKESRIYTKWGNIGIKFWKTIIDVKEKDRWRSLRLPNKNIRIKNKNK